MKFTVKRPVEIEIAFVRIAVPIRYGEEDIPNDFPLRTGDAWEARVGIKTGLILGWPDGAGERQLRMKVRDEGTYTLFGPDGREIATRNDYVPHGVVPGEYGDYIDLIINSEGTITNWPKQPDVSAFFPGD